MQQSWVSADGQQMPDSAAPDGAAAASDLYGGGSSGEEDENWRLDPATAPLLNQLASCIKQRGRNGEEQWHQVASFIRLESRSLCRSSV